MVAINIDTRDPEKPKNFLKDGNLTRLGYFSDPKAKVFQDLKAVGRALGMPTSVLIDGQGCEIATIAGPAEWASDDAVKLIRAAMKPVTAGFQAETSRLPPTPAPRLADEFGPAPNRVMTADFSASAFCFMNEAATCIWVLLACIASMLLTIAIISIRNTPNAGTLPSAG